MSQINNDEFKQNVIDKFETNRKQRDFTLLLRHKATMLQTSNIS